jgi:hypothetical protein
MQPAAEVSTGKTSVPGIITGITRDGITGITIEIISLKKGIKQQTLLNNTLACQDDARVFYFWRLNFNNEFVYSYRWKKTKR